MGSLPAEPLGKPVEINEEHPNEKRQRVFIQSKGAFHHHLYLAQESGGEVKLHSRKEGMYVSPHGAY